VLSKQDQDHLVENIVDHLKDAADFIQVIFVSINLFSRNLSFVSTQDRAIKNFSMVDSGFGQRLRDGVNKFKSSVKSKSANL